MKMIKRTTSGRRLGNKVPARVLSVTLSSTLIILPVSFFPTCTAFAQNVTTVTSTPIRKHLGSSLSTDLTGCKQCHKAEVEGYERSAMAHSLRAGGQEPVGSVEIPDGKITVESSTEGSWQVLDSGGIRTRFHVDYVIGSGTHANGYLTDIGNHLFQSPIAYYMSRHAYSLAPGFETNPDPDFTRPVTQGCLFCHAGTSAQIIGTRNEFEAKPFSAMGIGCARCHGSPAAHLADPGPGDIINPAKLPNTARDSICEQCHLIGVARVLNPGRIFGDFQAGQNLEDTFTVYRNVLIPGTVGNFRVISQSEQLALSACARNSGGKLWCGTCHDPHLNPSQPIAYYRSKCLSCHNTGFPASHPAANSNCIGCHMPKRSTTDGGHTTFTDHRIQRRPEPQLAITDDTDIAAWRAPSQALQERNLGIAYIEVGMDRRSPRLIVRGYRMLTEVQNEFPRDSELFTWIGNALLIGRQYSEAERAFEIALSLDPNSDLKEANAGQAYAAAGDFEKAKPHLERALQLDPLDLAAATSLIQIYRNEGNTEAADQISNRIKQSIHQN